MRRAIPLLLLAAAAAAADWWEVQRDVTARLLDRDVGEWARELEAQPMPADARGLMVRFDVLLRAGHLGRLPPVLDALVPVAESDDAVDALVGRGCLDLARRALERFPHVDRDTVESYVRACGDGIDEEWLAARAAGSDVFYEPWFSLRVRRGTARPLLEKLAEGVRGQPADMKTARRYLWARREAEAEDDLSWMAEVVRPRLAVESEELAGWFARDHPLLAAFFLERSLGQPFTAEDDRYLRMRMSLCLMESLEPRFRDGTKAELARVYLRIDEPLKAQALMEDLARRYPDGLPSSLCGLAGQVQGSSGARVIEGRIRAKEGERKDDAQYWLGRAEYFAGRKEDADARAAYEKALALAPPSHEKGRILHSYTRYLANTGREPEAHGLRDRAFSEAEPGSDYAYSVLTMLLHGGWSPGPEDERCWRHLGARAVWHDERRLLERMARLPERRPDVWRRATALTGDADPSRAVMLAEAMIHHGDCHDAIPLLRGALPRLERPDRKYWADHLLFDALVRERDWRGAEEIAGADALRLGRAAVVAKQAGETREASRLWARRTNLDRLSTEGVKEMEAAGGGDIVRACHAAIGERDRDFRP